MGRHSRPDDVDEDISDIASATVLEDTEPQGRHARAEVAALDELVPGLPGVGEPIPLEPLPKERKPRPGRRPKPPPAPKPPRARKPGGSAGDLRLVRAHGDVRNRCIAALLAPFVIYTAVMLVIGRFDDYLFWVWAPTVLAGVLVGSTLDHAHKRYPSG